MIEARLTLTANNSSPHAARELRVEGGSRIELLVRDVYETRGSFFRAS
jgi:hypothetical protein